MCRIEVLYYNRRTGFGTELNTLESLSASPDAKNSYACAVVGKRTTIEQISMKLGQKITSPFMLRTVLCQNKQ